MEENILFEEKQYLGSDKLSLVRRMVFSLFCFIAYYWSENPKAIEVSGIRIGSYPVSDIENSGQIFFILGIMILILSLVLVFILQLHTVVNQQKVILNGFGLWSKIVEIDIADIVSLKKIKYNKSYVGRPVYNLHNNDKVRFYTRGIEAVEITNKAGLKYRIGSQKADELLKVLASFMAQKGRN